MNDLDSLVVVPVISLNPKKAKKKLKKAARSDENDCTDSRLPVHKMNAVSDSFEVVCSVPLSSKSSKAPVKKCKPAAADFRPPLVEKKVTSPSPQSQFTSTFEDRKKSWYDITMDDDDDFCPQ